MVLKYTGEELYKSTYASLYRKNPEDTKCRPKYHQLVSLSVDAANQVRSRNHPDYIGTRKFVRPPGLDHDYPICLGLGSYVDVPLQNTDKPIVRTDPPQKCNLAASSPVKTSQKNRKDEADETFQDKIVRLRWVSTTKREEEGNCLPVPKWDVPCTTLEDNADMVRQRPQRYEQTACDWQNLSRAWNKIQPCSNINSSGSGSDKKVPSGKGTVWDRRQKIMDDLRQKSKPATIADQCRLRKLPGFAGFVPREPVESRFDPSCSEIFRSSASRVYRAFPHDVMNDPRTMTNHRKAPLSRMITLVYPSNPFKITPSTMHTSINPVYN
ncbi:uncharacterized protein LOC100177770 [Ciona intestinalis]